MRGQPTDLPIPALSSFTPAPFLLLLSRQNPHLAIVEELLAKTEYSSVSKEPTLRPEDRKSVIKDWRVIFQRNILAS